jgi:hypothetical protein
VSCVVATGTDTFTLVARIVFAALRSRSASNRFTFASSAAQRFRYWLWQVVGRLSRLLAEELGSRGRLATPTDCTHTPGHSFVATVGDPTLEVVNNMLRTSATPTTRSLPPMAQARGFSGAFR